MSTAVAVVVGFVRSGSSLVAKLLAKHPEVHCLFQPDSGTVIHRTQWEHWGADHHEPQAERFFGSLLEGRLDRDFLASKWFENHSSAHDVVQGALHVLKSTKLHLKVEWLRARFPELPVHAITRAPMAILTSLVRNDFHRTWYGGDHFDHCVRYLERAPTPMPRLLDVARRVETDAERMAVLIAARTEALLRAVPANRIVSYERILEDPNRELGAFVSRFGKAPFDFARYASDDYNVIGKPFEGQALHGEIFSPGELRRFETIFEAARDA
jgi:hypothetical protein